MDEQGAQTEHRKLKLEGGVALLTTCKAWYWSTVPLGPHAAPSCQPSSSNSVWKEEEQLLDSHKGTAYSRKRGTSWYCVCLNIFGDGMLDRTSEVTEGTDDTYTMPSRVESQRRPTLTRSKPTNSAKRITQLVEQSAKAKTLVLKVDELGTYHILLPLVPGAKV